MKNIFISLTAILMITFSAMATNDNTSTTATTTLSGQVTDKVTGEALAGVKIIVDQHGSEVYTDFEGKFSINNISTGVHEIKTDLISYKSQQKSIEVSTTCNSMKVEIEIDNN